MFLPTLLINVLLLSNCFAALDTTHENTKYWFRHDGSLQFLGKQQEQRVAIDIEIVEDEQARNQGLMYRKKLKPLHGMLFLFEDEEPRSFYMKNTHIPLDIIFVKTDKEISKIYQNTIPLSLTNLPSEQPAHYVVEVNAGFCQKHGIQVGDRISFIRN
jgi:uncharacterized membrane protein (UPF0127 family)